MSKLTSQVLVRMDVPFPLVSLLAIMLVFTLSGTAAASVETTENQRFEVILGAVVDISCRKGKEEKVAMQMAVEDLNKGNNQSLILQVRDSQEPLQAALVAKDLINIGAQAILGPDRWEETSLIAEIGSQYHIPVLSLADWMPKWATKKWPFLLAASPNQYAQMKAIASIMQSYEWQEITIIYDDLNSLADGTINYLSDAMREVGVEVSHVVLPPLDCDLSLSEELGRLQREQCRVFVVHLQFPAAVRLFESAKKMKMMEKGYVWITTTSFTNLVQSIKASTIANSMQGIIGVRSYSPINESQFQDFSSRFSKRFSLEHPEEGKDEPGFYATQAYDAIWTVARALNTEHRRESLLEEILGSNFLGLSGEVHFVHRSRAPSDIFQIINIVGRSYREIGFWSDNFGFSETTNHDNPNNSASMKELGPVFWPGGPSDTPKGWNFPTDAKPLRIGVPNSSLYKQYVNVQNDTSFGGLAIELFEAAVKLLPFPLPYKFLPFNGKYDELVEQVHLKNFDAVVGDVSITAERCQKVDFTQPYTKPELVMIVPLESKAGNRAWLFLRPFTISMWILIGILNVYNGFVVWFIERKHLSELNGSAINQTGSLLWFSISTLFSYHGERLHSNLARMTMAMWLFMALILTQVYTANLASILTVQRLAPVVTNIEILQHSNAKVGYSKVSFVEKYLTEVLRFNSENVRAYVLPEELANGLRNKEIAAIFLEEPIAKLFLTTYCKSFSRAGPSFKVGGYGFVFPRRSPLLPRVTEAVLKVSESGKQRELVNSMLASENCVEIDSDDHKITSLSPNNFWVLFLLTGSTSTISLMIYASRSKSEKNPKLIHKMSWTLMSAAMRSWRDTRFKLFPGRVTSTESPADSKS